MFFPRTPLIFVLVLVSSFGFQFGSCSAQPFTIVSDQSVLLALKKAVVFDPILATNWTHESSVCSWIGVTCSIRHNRVIALDLPHRALRGILPPQLGNLSFLILLNLENNSFYGDLPSELSRLRRLRFVSLYLNNFTGNVPSWLGDLPRLQYLDVGNNSYIGSLPNGLFRNGSNLEMLSMSHNFIDGEIPREVENLKKLKVLSMEDNQLTGIIPPSLFNISSLNFIAFSWNRLSGGLPKDTCLNLPNLIQLHLSKNQLSGEITCRSFQGCSKLEILSISDNKFEGFVPREIGNLTMLKELYLGINNWQGNIPFELVNLVNLECLDFHKVSVGTSLLPSFVFNISSLKELDLSENSYKGHVPKDLCSSLPVVEVIYLNRNNLIGSIPSSISNCSSLNEIDLGDNKLTGEIPKEMGELRKLDYLRMTGNQLSGSIPQSIFNISSLQEVSIVSNQLSGNLPSNLGINLPNLEILFLGGNNLSGRIPESISNASNLVSLDFSQNSLTGLIPNTFGNLRYLQVLTLGTNKLTGLSFIPSLANCKYLSTLWLSRNPLNDVFPSSIGNLSSLSRLSMTNCGMSGIIPLGIGNLINLKDLILNDNHLQGYLPVTINSLKRLQRFNARRNNLQGPILDELCSLSDQLGLLDLGENEFSGQIPTCIGELTSLRELSLDSNKLISSIPMSFSSLSNLLLLNLSHNSFSGEIPNNLRVLKALLRLSLAQNELQGPIPEFLGELINIQYLDLSHNNFFGEIPKSLEALTQLIYFTVSFNQLLGEIPNGGPFRNFTGQSFLSNLKLCGLSQFQVPPCSHSSYRSRKKTSRILLYVLVSIASLIIATTFIVIFIMLRRRRKAISRDVEPLTTMTHTRITYYELSNATRSFSESNLLGVGSYGAVYKGTLINGTTLAIKVFNLQIEGGFKSFDKECKILSQLRHRNLTKVITCCSNEDFKALILEYMPNGSLGNRLHNDTNYLSLIQRLDIVIDIASALEYLHHGYSVPVAHCDLKPDNVLLDNEMIAHVSDFGISRLLGIEESITQTRTLGTFGYIAPEYGLDGLVSIRCDVYSFGIVLLEIFTMKKPTDDIFSGEMSLRKWVNDLYPHSMVDIIDSNLLKMEQGGVEKKIRCITSMIELALNCSSDLAEERLSMKDICPTLLKIKARFLA